MKTNSPTRSERCRAIVRDHQAAKIDGVLVDAFTASAIIAVYDRLNDANKQKMDALPITKMAEITWSLLREKENGE